MSKSETIFKEEMLKEEACAPRASAFPAVSNFEFVSDFGFRISDFRARRSRRGFSFAEVMFAVIILGIGFIMIAAIFPVAIQQSKLTVDESTAAGIARTGVSMVEQVATEATLPPTDLFMDPTVPSGSPPLPHYVTPAAVAPVPGGGVTLPAGQSWTFPGKVVSFHDPRISDAAPLTDSSGAPVEPGFYRSRAWNSVRGNLVFSADARYAWVPLYKRDRTYRNDSSSAVDVTDPAVTRAAEPIVQIILIPVQIQNRTQFDASDTSKVGTPQPDYFNLQPRPLVATSPARNELDTDIEPNTIALHDVIASSPAWFPRMPGAVNALAEGTYVVISDDNLDAASPPYNPQTGWPMAQVAGHLNGRVYRLGLRRPELDASNGSTAGNPVQVWDLALSSELRPEQVPVPDSNFVFDPGDPIYTLNHFTNALVLVVRTRIHQPEERAGSVGLSEPISKRLRRVRRHRHGHQRVRRIPEGEAMRQSKSTSSDTAHGFTLIELMISIALVLLLMVGINQVFKVTGETVGTSQTIADGVRDARAVQSVMADDMAHMLTGRDSPCMIIRSERTAAFKDRKDELGDRDYSATLNTPSAVDDSIRTTDMDGDNVEDPPTSASSPDVIPRAIYGVRNRRIDQINFFARGTFRRQTGNDGTYVADMSSNAAWIWYGHLKQPDSTGAANQYKLLGTGVPDLLSGDPIGTFQTNPNNFYSSQWILGRMIVLLRTPTTPGNVINDDEGVSQYYVGAAGGLSPFAPLGQESRATTSTRWDVQWSRFDLAGVEGTGDPVQSFNTVLATGMGTYPEFWAGAQGMMYRFQGSPYPLKPLSAEGMARVAPTLLQHCSQFMVEFAGDFLSQDDAPTLPDGSINPNYGAVTALQPDNQIDFIINEQTKVKTIRWYGFSARHGQQQSCRAGPPRWRDSGVPIGSY
jgi:prepilin-type N-terminal cleavage/methylation domain-containing protein